MDAEEFVVNLFCFGPLALVLAVILCFCVIYIAVYWRRATRKRLVTAGVGSLIIGIALCGWFGWMAFNLQRNFAWRDQAESGREATLASLPNLNEFEQIATVRQTIGAPVGPGWYGRAYVVVGTDLPAETAVVMYGDALSGHGWQISPYRHADYAVLERGEHERLVISPASEYLEPINAVKNDPACIAAKQRYRTIMVMSIDYIVPCRDDC